MIVRFCLYSVFKNLRFADPFLVLYLLHLGLSYSAIGLLLGAQHLLTGLTEVPLGVVADRFGRRRSLAACFLAYGLAFVLFAVAGRDDWPLMSLLAAATALFAIGEALRTGSHKAIILDWLDARGESARATEVIGFTRTFSKVTSGLAAGGAGLLVFAFGRFDVLFWLSAAAALGGLVNTLGYPKELEGETMRDVRAGRHERRTLRDRLAALVANPGLVPLFVTSVIFESQLKLVLRYFGQPFFQAGLAAMGVPLVSAKATLQGTGAVWIGLVELVRDVVGGAAARLAVTFERLAGSRRRALSIAYVAALAGAVALAGCALSPAALVIPGVVFLVLLTALQNARRPIFVSAFNEVMDKPQRATTLSVESQARTLVLAVMLPVTGWIADGWGLGVVFATTAGLLLLGTLAAGRAAPRERP